MFETKFVISNLENGWDWPDINSSDDALIYVCDELEIPEDFIKTVRCKHKAFELQLTYSKQYFRDDWYVNLQRQKSA